MIVMGIILWLAAGAIGWWLMRQGFLVDFESSLGKKRAWGIKENVAGFFFALLGPVAILAAFFVTGTSCLKKRTK